MRDLASGVHDREGASETDPAAARDLTMDRPEPLYALLGLLLSAGPLAVLAAGWFTD